MRRSTESQVRYHSACSTAPLTLKHWVENHVKASNAQLEDQMAAKAAEDLRAIVGASDDQYTPEARQAAATELQSRASPSGDSLEAAVAPAPPRDVRTFSWFVSAVLLWVGWTFACVAVVMALSLSLSGVAMAVLLVGVAVACTFGAMRLNSGWRPLLGKVMVLFGCLGLLRFIVGILSRPAQARFDFLVFALLSVAGYIALKVFSTKPERTSA